MRVNKSLAAGLATVLAASAASVIGLAAPAQAATGSTGTLNGSPSNKVGLSAYTNEHTLSLTAVQDGNDIDVTVFVGGGPSSVASQAAAGSYRMDAFVRLDGAATDRGVRMVGPVGAAVVEIGEQYYPTGTTITGTFEDVSLGSHTVTLTDLLLESNGASSGNAFGSAADGSDAVGFDAWYNLGATTAAVTRDSSPTAGYQWDETAQAATPYTPIGLQETVEVTSDPQLSIAEVNGQVAGITDYARNNQVIEVSGLFYDANQDPEDFTVTYGTAIPNSSAPCVASGLGAEIGTITNGERTGNVVTYTASGTYTVGQTVNISGTAAPFTGNAFTGNKTITAVGAGTFSFASNGADVVSQAASGSVKANLAATGCANLSTDAEGNLSGTIVLGTGKTAGAGTLSISDGVGSDTVALTLLGAPTLTIDEAEGDVGTVVTYTGTNFDPESNYIAYAAINNPSGGFYALPNGTNPLIDAGPPAVYQCPGGFTPPAPETGCVGSGPYIPGELNDINLGQVNADGTVSGSVVVEDEGTIRITVAGKSIIDGVPAGGADITNGSQGVSAAQTYTVLPDDTAPTGTAAVTPLTGVVPVNAGLTISDVADNVSDPAAVVATVNWGDGTPAQALAAGVTTASHTYSTPGSYPVSVTLKDELGNESTAIAAGTVVATAVPAPPADTANPLVTIDKPGTKKAVKASAWRKLKGGITDNDSGPKWVKVKVVVKTANGWKYLDGKKWKKAKNKKQALKKADVYTDKSVSSGVWKIKLKKKPVVGKLIVQRWGSDNAGNVAPKRNISQKITKK